MIVLDVSIVSDDPYSYSSSSIVPSVIDFSSSDTHSSLYNKSSSFSSSLNSIRSSSYPDIVIYYIYFKC
ncbi:ORF MSV101 hypothetical protein [Melanoplus sanguinipes entomopoxvirus]|uniref:Uncharacterized protein n=1 Tax=Melanoplus sanguinipes entomopoxvirus TaxID=83191 RepID=Q9YVZ2_MSEPV|nr:ORF MSV101 hypothetical protein [Melanoplus sanguinipes entomopoxvirus]AAC97806.1 ORF MSV101 hypothetical protein [Melanoplus sanguinipes entomopoxvirus 'O']